MVLRLYTDIDKPDIRKTAERLNNNLSIPLDLEKVKGLGSWCTTVLKFLEKFINIECGKNPDEYINFTGRSNTPNHITNRILAYYDNASWVNNIVVTNSGGRTSSIDSMERLKAEAKRRKFSYSILDAVIMHNQLRFILTNNLNQFTNSINKGEALYEMKPRINVGDTGRMTTSNPNIQGFVNVVKKCIKAPEGWKIVSMDITGQEVHILIFGIMENKAVKEGYIKYKDPYKAFLHLANIPITPATRKIIKVPVLATINGMSLAGIKGQLTTKFRELSPEEQEEIERHGGAVQMGTTIYNLINEDSNYKRLVLDHANKVDTPEGKRRGLFGSEFPVNSKSTKNGKMNQLKNGFFQVTAAEMLSLSIDKLLNMGVQDEIKFLVPIYDEVVLMVKDSDNLEKNVTLIEDLFKPVVDDWVRFRGTPIVADYYDDGDSNKIITPDDLYQLQLPKVCKEELDELVEIVNKMDNVNWLWK